jgi:hypothetical protein
MRVRPEKKVQRCGLTQEFRFAYHCDIEYQEPSLCMPE